MHRRPPAFQGRYGLMQAGLEFGLQAATTTLKQQTAPEMQEKRRTALQLARPHLRARAQHAWRASKSRHRGSACQHHRQQHQRPLIEAQLQATTTKAIVEPVLQGPNMRRAAACRAAAVPGGRQRQPPLAGGTTATPFRLGLRQRQRWQGQMTRAGQPQLDHLEGHLPAHQQRQQQTCAGRRRGAQGCQGRSMAPAGAAAHERRGTRVGRGCPRHMGGVHQLTCCCCCCCWR